MQTMARKTAAELTAEDFRPHLKTAFRIEHQQGYRDVELLSVDAYPHLTPPFAQRACFALLFQDLHGQSLPNWVYNIRHDQIGLIEGVLVTQVLVPAHVQKLAKPGETVPSFFEAVFN